MDVHNKQNEKKRSRMKHH